MYIGRERETYKPSVLELPGHVVAERERKSSDQAQLAVLGLRQ